jgi:hypothetical protein
VQDGKLSERFVRTEVVRAADLGKGKYCNFEKMVKGEKWTACENADFVESCCALKSETSQLCRHQ